MLEKLRVSYALDNLETICQVYNTYGLVVVQGLVPLGLIESYKEGLLRLMRRRLDLLGQDCDRNIDLDETFNFICELDRKIGGEIYDVAKDFLDFYQFVTHERILAIVKALIGTDFIQAPYRAFLFRMDRPNEDKFTFDWHYDYPYNLMSINTVTGWFPLTNVTPEMGQLRVIPQSHKEMCKVVVNIPNYMPGKGGYDQGRIFSIAKDVEELERESIDIPAQAGDALFFHSLLLHRSGVNKSLRTRWVVNPRYSNFLDEALVKRGWIKNFFSGKEMFSEIHPDKIISTKE